ncbi:unnamed protein product, partial [Laminaria digitata]
SERFKTATCGPLDRCDDVTSITTTMWVTTAATPYMMTMTNASDDCGCGMLGDRQDRAGGDSLGAFDSIIAKLQASSTVLGASYADRTTTTPTTTTTCMATGGARPNDRF